LRTIKRLLTLLIAAGFATGAAAQLRTIPQEAKAGKLRHLQETLVELDGKPALLSPGAQIRDLWNRLVLPASITQTTAVRYLTDSTGTLHRVWILSPEEAAQALPAPKPAPLPAPKDDAKSDDDAK